MAKARKKSKRHSFLEQNEDRRYSMSVISARMAGQKQPKRKFLANINF